VTALIEELSNIKDTQMLSGTSVSPEAIDSIIETLSFGIKQANIANKNYNPKKSKK
jgi:hypothetical protein